MANRGSLEFKFDDALVLRLFRLPLVIIGALLLLLILATWLLFVSIVNNGRSVRHSITWLRRRSYGPLCSSGEVAA